MATIKGTISPVAGELNYLIITIYRTTSPLAEVDRIVKAAPHGAPYNFQFSDVDPGNYIVMIHNSVDGVALNDLKHDYWTKAVNSGIAIERHFFTVGIDVADGATQYLNALFDGKTLSGLFEEGMRYLEPGLEWQQIAGGLELLSGRVFSSSQKWTVEASYIVESSSVGGAAAGFSTIVLKPDNVALTAADLNKCIMATGVANQDIPLPVLGPIVDGGGYMIKHDGGSVNVKIQAAGSDVIRFRGNDVGYVYLGKGESLKVIKGMGKWYVIDEVGGWERVGLRMGVDQVGDNMVDAIGGEIDGNVYRRVYDWVTSLPPAQQINLATWVGDATKQLFFGVDTVTKKIRVPDMRGMSHRYLKNIGGVDPRRPDNIPGGYQEGMVGPHDHSVTVGSNTYNRVLTVTGTSTTDSPDNTPGEPNLALSQPMGNGGGSETSVENVGLFPVILI